MSTPSSGGPEWSGDMLDRPEMVAAFTAQLRRVLSDQADFVARIRRDAEAMWEANPPEGYGTFEAWWRHRWVAGPFAEIQEHIEKAATLTFQLEARYRRNRHEIPATRQAAAHARQQGPQLTRGAGPVDRPTPRRPAGPRPASDDGGFLDLIRAERRDRSA
ncbi:hypothetical protein [Planomonospora sp. ID82291]|uniref:hypothetical protein n=1 Tax=Planomonospora sp. ID82291 TaxID=2738136 RepID=UPI0018C3FA93|nr:hypothetical protein [Planomonospora sp. ID82291]MBG0819090.1 hypothetical protein [Planomonospora sp. ID82291]